jgi:hypothetical protein
MKLLPSKETAPPIARAFALAAYGTAIMFLASSAFAYQQTGTIPNTGAHLATAAGIGLTTTFAASAGAAVVGVVGAFAGAILGAIGSYFTGEDQPTAKGGCIHLTSIIAPILGIAGALGGLSYGGYESYTHTKDFALKKFAQPAPIVHAQTIGV